jgi:hypothetical protein
MTIAAVAALALAVTLSPQPASARGGAIAAGIIGGVAVGAIIGSQANGGYYYGGPAYYQPSYQPVYSNCRVERQQVEDGYGRIRIQRVRVCD